MMSLSLTHHSLTQLTYGVQNNFIDLPIQLCLKNHAGVGFTYKKKMPKPTNKIQGFLSTSVLKGV